MHTHFQFILDTEKLYPDVKCNICYVANKIVCFAKNIKRPTEDIKKILNSIESINDEGNISYCTTYLMIMIVSNKTKYYH